MKSGKVNIPDSGFDCDTGSPRPRASMTRRGLKYVESSPLRYRLPLKRVTSAPVITSAYSARHSRIAKAMSALVWYSAIDMFAGWIGAPGM
jgi:hypothetical protein